MNRNLQSKRSVIKLSSLSDLINVQLVPAAVCGPGTSYRIVQCLERDKPCIALVNQMGGLGRIYGVVGPGSWLSETLGRLVRLVHIC